MHDALLKPFTANLDLAVASLPTWEHVQLHALCSISESSVDAVDLSSDQSGNDRRYTVSAGLANQNLRLLAELSSMAANLPSSSAIDAA
jgi:hypothetical protein